MATTKEPASNEEWKKWGDLDPLFGVASWDNRNIDGSNPWTVEEFYELGKVDWADFRKQWESYGLVTDTCLEIGCGAGRITRELAECFEKVHALDVSENMIAFAKKHVTSPNISFHLTQGCTIPLENSAASAAFSTHVFQHFDTLDVARAYFTELARVIAPGGTIMIHMPIHRWPCMPAVFDTIYALNKTVGHIKSSIKRALMRKGLTKPIMRSLWYPTEFVYTELQALGFENIQIHFFTTRSNQDLHPVVLAQRSKGRG